MHAVPAEIVRYAVDFQPHQGEEAVRQDGFRVDEKLQGLILAAGQIERLAGHSKADGGMAFRHKNIIVRIGHGPAAAAAEIKHQQPGALHRHIVQVGVQPRKAEPDTRRQLVQLQRGGGGGSIGNHVIL